MGKYVLTYKAFGDSALLIEWPSEMNQSIHKEVISFYQKLQKNKTHNIIEVIQSINSLTIVYDPVTISFDKTMLWAENTFKKTLNPKEATAYYLWKIPVCYDDYFGLDLCEIALEKKLSIDTIVKIHSQSIYQVYSIGFLPGFLYLGGLNEQLHINRRPSPRLEIQKGAVGIGGEQTGIYPTISPGGWQIIGNSPINFFDVTKDIPCFAKPGDKILFIPISSSEHKAISELVSTNSYTLEKEVVLD